MMVTNNARALASWPNHLTSFINDLTEVTVMPKNVRYVKLHMIKSIGPKIRIE
jgi:hypothetical protein